MKTFLAWALKLNNLFLIKTSWKLQSLFNKRYETELWLDKNGNTLAHYVCLHQNAKLWNFIKNKPINLNHLNKEGKAPIHTFVEHSFLQNIYNFKKEKSIFDNLRFNITLFIVSKLILFFEKNYHYYSRLVLIELLSEQNNISVSFNEELLKELIDKGADINQFMYFSEREENGWTPSDLGASSRSDIMGTPLECLITLFWERVLPPSVKNNNKEVIEEYEHFFHTLTKLGANPNTILQAKLPHPALDDINIPHTRIVSIFFTRFIADESDFIVIKPFFEDEFVDFSAKDYSNNTLLHTLFGRLSSKKYLFSDKVCEEIFALIENNKKITPEILKIKNRSDLMPLDLLRGEAGYLRKKLNAFTLHHELQQALASKEIDKEKSLTKPKVRKI